MGLNRKCRGGGIFTNTTTVLYVWLFSLTLGHAHVYTVDDSEGLGRRFDGIGGLSGGGVRFRRRSGRHAPALGLDMFKKDVVSELRLCLCAGQFSSTVLVSSYRHRLRNKI